MQAEGKIQIALTLTENANSKTVNGVQIDSNRPIKAAAQVLEGKTIAEVLELLPLMFNVCGRAQTCAGVRAMEKALGIHVHDQVEKLRDAVVNMETLRELLWRIYLDWPDFNNTKVNYEYFKKVLDLQKQYETIIDNKKLFILGAKPYRIDVDALTKISEELMHVVETSLLSVPIYNWLQIFGDQSFDRWLKSADTTAAHLIKKIAFEGWSSAGNHPLTPLPTLTRAVERELSKSMQDPNFIAQPSWQGQCCESTSLTRVTTPLLITMAKSYGNGLLTRVIARLTEIAMLTQQLVPHNVPDTNDTPILPIHRHGLGAVAAARGQLFHRVKIKKQCILEYQILAPTEWHFHPQGVAYQSLCQLYGDRHAIEQQARLLINIIDPCVGYEFSLVNDSKESNTNENSHA